MRVVLYMNNWESCSARLVLGAPDEYEAIIPERHIRKELPRWHRFLRPGETKAED